MHLTLTIISSLVLLFMGGQQAWAQGSGPDFRLPVDIAIESTGTLLVVDQNGQRRSVIRVDPLTGSRTTVSDDVTGDGPFFDQPSGMVIENDQSLLVTDESIDRMVSLIAEYARTGEPGDGVIAVQEVNNLMRIRDIKQPS